MFSSRNGRIFVRDCQLALQAGLARVALSGKGRIGQGIDQVHNGLAMSREQAFIQSRYF
jgi:hypothetical protein